MLLSTDWPIYKYILKNYVDTGDSRSRSEKSFYKRQIVNILGFANSMVSVITTHFWLSMKSHTQYVTERAWKSISTIHINRMKNRNMIILTDTGNKVDKQHSWFKKKTSTRNRRKLHQHIIKVILKNPQVTSYSMVKDWKLFLYTRNKTKMLTWKTKADSFITHWIILPLLASHFHPFLFIF